MKKLFLLIIAAPALFGCAADPDSIHPAYVSELVYDQYSCLQLGQEEAKLQSALTTVSKEQKDARSGDAWGVALLGVPVSSFSGKNVAAQVAEVKGNLNAVQEAEVKKSCNSSALPSPTHAQLGTQ